MITPSSFTGFFRKAYGSYLRELFTLAEHILTSTVSVTLPFMTEYGMIRLTLHIDILLCMYEGWPIGF